MDTNFQHLTHYIRIIINCKYTTPVAIISHKIILYFFLYEHIVALFIIYTLYMLNKPKETMKKYKVSLSEKDIEFLRDCIDFQYEMYDDNLQEKDRWEKENINKLIEMETKLRNVVCPPIKYHFKKPSKFDKLMMGLLLK